MENERTGYIYVLTNESFHRDNWIKIGYAEDVAKRVKELSNTSVPLPYEVYCTYEIPRIKGVKDPDKLLHELIAKLNPGLRISQNREFFEMLPLDAYEMLQAIAQMHGRIDKLSKNESNSVDQDIQSESEYSVEMLFPIGSHIRLLFDKIKKITVSVDPSLEEAARQYYVTYKKNGVNTISLWPKSGCVEVVLGAKIGQINDPNDMIYDITSRKWSASHYAFKFYEDTDIESVKNIIEQVIKLKK